MLEMEECALGMEHRCRSNYAAVKDAQITLRLEECASSMELRSNFAAVMDAQIKFGKEACALGMGRNATHTHVAVKDV